MHKKFIGQRLHLKGQTVEMCMLAAGTDEFKARIERSVTGGDKKYSSRVSSYFLAVQSENITAEIAMNAVRSSGENLKYIPDEVQNFEICRAALKNREIPECYDYVKKDRDLHLRLLKEFPYLILYTPFIDWETIKKCVRFCGDSLKIFEEVFAVSYNADEDTVRFRDHTLQNAKENIHQMRKLAFKQ